MQNIDKILYEDESVLVEAEISKTFYNPLLKLYTLGFFLLFIGYEYSLGVIGAVLIIRTFFVHILEIKEKKSYHCVLTQKRLIILKGHKIKEIFPVELYDIKTIYIKPITLWLKKIVDVGTLEVVTNSGGRFVIHNIKKPYLFHRAIIGDIVSAKL